MIAVCLRYLKSEEDAMEVLNNSFLKVFGKIKQYKSAGGLELWIKRIVINSSLDFIRSNKAYRNKFILTNEFSLTDFPDEDVDSSDYLPDNASFLNCDQIFELVKELPPATRIVFNLYVIDGFTHKQIAETLSISQGTSKWHLSNGRKLLKEKIKREVVKNNKDCNHEEEKLWLG